MVASVFVHAYVNIVIIIKVIISLNFILSNFNHNHSITVHITIDENTFGCEVKNDNLIPSEYCINRLFGLIKNINNEYSR
jgi:hypothetical protein